MLLKHKKWFSLHGGFLNIATYHLIKLTHNNKIKKRAHDSQIARAKGNFKLKTSKELNLVDFQLIHLFIAILLRMAITVDLLLQPIWKHQLTGEALDSSLYEKYLYVLTIGVTKLK